MQQSDKEILLKYFSRWIIKLFKVRIIQIKQRRMKFYQSQGNNQKQQSKLKYPILPEIIQTKQVQIEKKATIFDKKQQSKQQKQKDMRESVFLKNKEDEEQGWFQKCCACTQLEYYKDYFKVTNDDVQKRISANLMFWQGKFFEPAEQEYDFYGPFWIHTTIVFCLGAVHNLLQYQGNPNYDYDFEIIGEAFFAMYALGFGMPIGIAFIMKQIGVNCTIIQILSLYGYSVSIYIFCIILCSFNICLLHWIFLGYGVANKIYFLFKNINEGFQIPAGKKIVVTVLVILEATLQFFIFKIRFIYCADQVIPIQGPQHMMNSPSIGQFIHMRSFDQEIPL